MTLKQVTRDQVLAAIASYDELGPDGFHAAYGYGQPVRYYLHSEDKDYPAKGIVGAAHMIGFGEKIANYSGGAAPNAHLKQLGFEVVDRGGFGQSSTHSSGKSLSIVLRWSAGSERDTVVLHKQVADARGSTWWGKIGDPTRTAVSAEKLEILRSQIRDGIATYAYLYRTGGDAWRTEILEITPDESEVDQALVPSYYGDEAHHLWLRLARFTPLDPEWPLDHLVLDSDPSRLLRTAIGGQATLFYVRPAGEQLPPDSIPERYFILLQKPDTDSLYADREGTRYRFDSNVTGRIPLVEAGAGHFVYYRPRRGADPETSQTFFGAGSIARVEETGTDEGEVTQYVAELSDYAPFVRPVHRSEYLPKVWNQQHSIASITKEEYDEIMRRGTGATQEFDMAWLERATLMDRSVLEEIIEALGETQVVLAGPPGTGKTWVAKAIVRHLTDGDKSRTRTVQFHPSYGYEEFIEGLRPIWDEKKGGIAFQPVDGIVLRMTEDAKRSGLTHYLVIDEMNRANLPRVFGELMFLFEYRDPNDSIELQYSTYREDGERSFHLPEDVRFIGTMNTADRSIRSIDSALRRRFEIFECPPDADVLSKWYEQPGRTNEIDGLAQGLRALNDQLAIDLDKHHTIGHTFLMEDTMTRQRLRRTWERQILPLIAEFFFDQPDRLQAYALESYWPSLA